MRWKPREIDGLNWNVEMLCVTVLMILSLNGWSAYAGSEPPQEKNDVSYISPVDCLMLLDRVDELTVDNAELVERLRLKDEKPECKSSFPWRWVVGGLIAGYVINDVVN